MKRSREYDDLAVALAEVRPVPRPEFAAELDRRVMTGFPHRSRKRSPQTALIARLRGLRPRRPAPAIAATALAVIAMATAVVAGSRSGSQQVALDNAPHGRPHSIHRGGETLSDVNRFSREVPDLEFRSAEAATGSSSAAGNAALPALGAGHREIERSAEIGLLAAPADVAEDSAKIFAAVHDANGIVLHSTTSSGKGAGARFELLIPSARLGDALAAFSSIDEVHSRHETTDDITKPTVTSEEELQDVQARVDSLLAQLAGAEVESEREAIAAELHAERRQAARLRNQLTRLHQRTTYSRVLVRIESGTSTEPGSTWGIGDAFDDAGHILGIAAGVTLVGLAVIAPLALLCLLAWLAQRLWLRNRRERALDA